MHFFLSGKTSLVLFVNRFLLIYARAYLLQPAGNRLLLVSYSAMARLGKRGEGDSRIEQLCDVIGSNSTQ